MNNSKKITAALALELLALAQPAFAGTSPDRVWILREDKCPGSDRVTSFSVGTDLLVTLASTAVGSLIDIAANYLGTDQTFVASNIVAWDAGFVVTNADPVATDFVAPAILVNIGPNPMKSAAIDPSKPSEEYTASPVVVLLCFDNAGNDPGNTALTAYVKHWKYDRFVDPTMHWFRDPERSVTLEVEMKSPDATSLFKLTLSAKADAASIGHAAPRQDQKLPWIKRPTMSFPSGRTPFKGETFGPVNVSATLTEIAQPSWLGKTFSTTLTGEKSALQDFVKQKLKEEIDPAARAQAKLGLANAASTALAAYDAAYTAASTASTTYQGAATPANKASLVVKLAVLRHQEVVTREAFDAAGMSFQPYPAIASP